MVANVKQIKREKRKTNKDLEINSTAQPLTMIFPPQPKFYITPEHP